MTDCIAMEAKRAEYLAGVLSEEESRAIEAHAGSCVQCAEWLEASSRLPTSLPQSIAPPVALRGTVLRSVSQRMHRRRATRRWVPLAIAATLVIGVALSRPADKAAMMRERESRSPHAMAESRAYPAFRELEAARAELLTAIGLAGEGDRLRLSDALERLTQQQDDLVVLVKEFES